MNLVSQFPHAVDNTMRSSLTRCQKQAYWRHELGLVSAGESRVDLVAGGAFAKGCEVARKAFYAEGKQDTAAVKMGYEALMDNYGTFACPKDSNKSADRMGGALLYYFGEHPLTTEKMVPLRLAPGKWGIEMGFSFPIENMRVHHPDGGAMEYAGRFDMLGYDYTQPNMEEVWVVDEKTTSQMGEKWVNQWPMDGQMTGYIWAARKILDQYGFQKVNVAGAIINGVAIRTLTSKIGAYECARFKTTREDWEVQRWFSQMRKDVEDWIIASKNSDHNYALGHACAYYLNPCEFVPLCKAKNPDRLMDGSYVVRFWDPREKT